MVGGVRRLFSSMPCQEKNRGEEERRRPGGRGSTPVVCGREGHTWEEEE